MERTSILYFILYNISVQYKKSRRIAKNIRKLYRVLYRRYTALVEIATFIVGVSIFYVLLKIAAYIILCAVFFKTNDLGSLPKFSDFNFLLP